MNQAPQIHPITDISLPKAEFASLSCGGTLCMVSGGDAEVVRLRIVKSGGGMDCRLSQVASIAELLIPENSVHYPDGEAGRIIDYNGANFNVSTTKHHTVFTLTALSSKLLEVLPVLEDVILGPAYRKRDFEVMRDIVAMRYATSLVNVDSMAAKLLKYMMRGHSHPKAKWPTVEEIRNISFDEVTDFCHNSIRGSRPATAFLSGNFSDSHLQAVENLLNTLPCDAKSPESIVTYRPEEPGIHTVKIPQALQGGIRMGLPIPSAASPAGVHLRNAICALGGYFGSRLMRNIREDKGYTYGIYSSMLNDLEGASMCISVQTDISTVEAVIDETRKEMSLLVQNPPQGDELERLRQYLALELAAAVDTPFSIADEYMRQATGLVPEGFFDARARSLASLSPEIISATASQYLLPENLRIAVATNR